MCVKNGEPCKPSLDKGRVLCDRCRGKHDKCTHWGRNCKGEVKGGPHRNTPIAIFNGLGYSFSSALSQIQRAWAEAVVHSIEDCPEANELVEVDNEGLLRCVRRARTVTLKEGSSKANSVLVTYSPTSRAPTEYLFDRSTLPQYNPRLLPAYVDLDEARLLTATAAPADDPAAGIAAVAEAPSTPSSPVPRRSRRGHPPGVRELPESSAKPSPIVVKIEKVAPSSKRPHEESSPVPSLAPRKKRTRVVESEEESADDIAAIPEADPEEPEGKTSGRLRRLTRTHPADRDSPVSTFCRLFVATAHAACQAFLGHTPAPATVDPSELAVEEAVAPPEDELPQLSDGGVPEADPIVEGFEGPASPSIAGAQLPEPATPADPLSVAPPGSATATTLSPNFVFPPLRLRVRDLRELDIHVQEIRASWAGAVSREFLSQSQQREWARREEELTGEPFGYYSSADLPRLDLEFERTIFRGLAANSLEEINSRYPPDEGDVRSGLGGRSPTASE